MKIRDSLSGNLIDVDDLNNTNTINIYTCGPTVYDYIHIGNARPLILTDLIIRLLKFKGKKINNLINITDIDDKILEKALKENKTEAEISSFFSEQFLKDFESMNLTKPTKILKVTDNINECIKYIEILIQKKCAYEKDGNVYFKIDDDNEYGKLSNNNINSLLKISERNEEDSKKIIEKSKKILKIDPNNVEAYNNWGLALINLNKNEEAKEKFKQVLKLDPDYNKRYDFILWKKATNRNWNSKWSKGKPGWHLECTVLIDKYFKNNLDIHIGGMDLKFPHHENERIIFMKKNNKEIAKLWVHNGFLNINNKKMSKSLNNSNYVKDFIKNNDANVLKYLFYTTKYSQSLNITDTVILSMKKEISKFTNMIIKFQEHYNVNYLIHDELSKLESEKLFKLFINELDNNLNTANALEILKLIVKKINIDLNKNNLNYFLYEKFIIAINILGFSFDVLQYKYNLNSGIVIKNKNNDQMHKKPMLILDKDE